MYDTLLKFPKSGSFVLDTTTVWDTIVIICWSNFEVEEWVEFHPGVWKGIFCACQEVDVFPLFGQLLKHSQAFSV